MLCLLDSLVSRCCFTGFRIGLGLLVVLALGTPATGATLAAGVTCPNPDPSGPISGVPTLTRANSFASSPSTGGVASCTARATASYGSVGVFAGMDLQGATQGVGSTASAAFNDVITLSFNGPAPSGVITAIFDWALTGTISGTLGVQPNGALFSGDAVFRAQVGFERFAQTVAHGASGFSSFISDPNEAIVISPGVEMSVSGSLNATARFFSPFGAAPTSGGIALGFMNTGKLASVQLFADGVPIDPTTYQLTSESGFFTVPEPTLVALLAQCAAAAGLYRRGRHRFLSDSH